MKYLKKFENKLLDDILDKISFSGMDSLSDVEKDLLDDFSKGKTPIIKQIKDDSEKSFNGKIGPYDASLRLTTKTSDEWYGTLIVNGIEYKGRLSFDEADNLIGIFDSDDSDVYTDLEGLEEEIYEFLEEAYFSI
jgi:hypothetical protein